MTIESDFSLLRERQKRRPWRELPVAIAHCMAATKLGSERMELLGRLYIAQDFAGRLATNAELTRCKAAMRGMSQARIVG